MHFVGNAAIILGDGSRELQPIYSPGFSILSAIIPVITIVSALWFSEKRHGGLKVRLAALLAAGIVGGLAIVGMHYIGNSGISNYRTHLDPRTIGGAVLIGCLAMTGVIVGVATLQDSWLNTFKWRFVSALVIAIAVPSLHFEASLAITFVFERPNNGNTAAQYQNVIVSSILTVMTIVTCVVIGVYTRQEIIEIKSKAEQVVVNCAWFDHQGRAMVTRNGILPCYTVTNKDNERGFDEDFNTNHPAFHWLFKVTHDWNSVSRFVQGMKSHLDSLANGQHTLRSGAQEHNAWNTTSADQQYSVVFRERFCAAAYDMAKTLRVDLTDVGVLYEGVMSFSTMARHAPNGRRFSWSSRQRARPVDIEVRTDAHAPSREMISRPLDWAMMCEQR